ncbi:Hypothetical protein NGAL_HAMBI490_59590 [Neorhizobium galegae bv. officinalis]|nr:Hypothetical protein NGAL_HAMBI490_59590 [Neorhizobium galegae bv. officinalis]
MSDEIRAMFAAKRAEAPARGQRDPITLFKTSVQTQIKKMDQEMKKPGSAKGTAATNWFKSYGGGYRLQLGKKPIELDGAKYWQVNDLEEAKVLFEGALTLADTDREFQKAIQAAKVEADTATVKEAATAKPKGSGKKAASK